MDLSGLEGKVSPDDLPWIKMGTGLEGNAFKVLRISEETGVYTVLVSAKKGTVNQAHVHSAPADCYILEGEIEYRAGVAKAGEWLYEPAGARHATTMHTMDTLYLSTIYGPIIFEKEDGSVDYVQDWQTIKAMRDGVDPNEAKSLGGR